MKSSIIYFIYDIINKKYFIIYILYLFHIIWFIAGKLVGASHSHRKSVVIMLNWKSMRYYALRTCFQIFEDFWASLLWPTIILCDSPWLALETAMKFLWRSVPFVLFKGPWRNASDRDRWLSAIPSLAWSPRRFCGCQKAQLISQ